MAKTLGDVNLSEYALVSDRITLFYLRYPTGRIMTELHSRTDREITFRAMIFRAADEREPAATGWASEREGDGEINRVACLENTETSAIGRALANLGFTASSRRPSREEMEQAARGRARLAAVSADAISVTPPAPRPLPVATMLAAREPVDADPLQRRANAVHDLLGLIERAEAIGFSERRGAAMRAGVQRADLTLRRVMRVERRLRAWMVRRRPHGR